MIGAPSGPLLGVVLDVVLRPELSHVDLHRNGSLLPLEEVHDLRSHAITGGVVQLFTVRVVHRVDLVFAGFLQFRHHLTDHQPL